MTHSSTSTGYVSPQPATDEHALAPHGEPASPFELASSAAPSRITDRGARVVTRGAARFVVTEWAQGFTKVVALDDASLDHLLEQYCFNDIDDAIDRCVAISPIVARLTREAA